ncbi:MAG: hypothetical protein ACOYMS_02735 [Terrimicrobiaceae bacterium]
MALPLPSKIARPEFLVVHEGRTALLLAVSSASSSDAAEAAHGGLFTAGSDGATFASNERSLLKEFIERATGLPETHAIGVFGLVLFPDVEHSALEVLFPDNPHERIHYLGREYLQSEPLAECLRQFAGHGEAEVEALRSCFAPESIVPARFSVRGRLDRNVEATLTDRLLDYDQEAWAKQNLHLAGDAAVVAEDSPAYGMASLVTGVAGSGKSLVLLFRACTQARLDRQSRSLMLTHNRALRHELESRFGDLGSPPNVEWDTFSAWASSSLALKGIRPKVVAFRERDALIEAAARAVSSQTTARRIAFLREEFDWMQDRALRTLEEYLAVERTGRGVRLTGEQRKEVFSVFHSYREKIEARGCEDWSGLCLRFWREIESGSLKPPFFDYIYVDEAQFFAPVWFHCVKRALRPGTGRLLLAADPTQGFLKRRASWTASGIDLRGRSTRLRRSYRNSRPILQFASDFYRGRLTNDEAEELNLPGELELASAPPGEMPRVEIVTSRQDEITRIANEIKALLDAGGSAGTVLVLVADGRRKNEVLKVLTEGLGETRVTDGREANHLGKIRVSALDAATGLESPIVFVHGAAALLEAEDDLQLTPDQHEELVRDNTRRLYMAFTRAGIRLVVTWIGPSPRWLPPLS